MSYNVIPSPPRVIGNTKKARRTLAAALIALLAVSASGCAGTNSSASAGSKLDELKKSGVVRMGVVDTLPTSGADATPTGLVPELTAMVFAKMGLNNIQTVPMEFGALIPSLQSNRIDVAAGGHYVTAERCKAITLADPSYYYHDGMAVAKGNPHNIKTFEDVAKSNIEMGAVSGSASIKQGTDAGVPESKIQKFADIPTMLDALKTGRIDAAPYSNVEISYLLTKPAYTELTATEPTTPLVNGVPNPFSVSIGFAKDAGDIAEAFNKAQAEMKQAGEFDALLKKWGQTKDVLQPANMKKIGEVCSEK